MMPRPIMLTLAVATAGEAQLARLAWQRSRAGAALGLFARVSSIWLAYRWLITEPS